MQLRIFIPLIPQLHPILNLSHMLQKIANEFWTLYSYLFCLITWQVMDRWTVIIREDNGENKSVSRNNQNQANLKMKKYDVFEVKSKCFESNDLQILYPISASTYTGEIMKRKKVSPGIFRMKPT